MISHAKVLARLATLVTGCVFQLNAFALPGTEISVFDSSPYEGQLQTRGLPSINSTFGYTFSGTEISAEFIIRGDRTLSQALATKGFDHINFMQIVTEYPDPLGVLSGCLGNTPFNDPPIGGCLYPYIPADNLPFYYDVGGDWVDTEFYIGDRVLQGNYQSTGQPVDVGVSFADQPFSTYASAANPMSFLLFPVGVYADGTYETLVTSVLSWESTNNFFDGSAFDATPVPLRSNPTPDGLDYTVLAGKQVSFEELSPQVLALLRSTGFIETNTVPEPSTLALLLAGFSCLIFSRRRSEARTDILGIKN